MGLLCCARHCATWDSNPPPGHERRLYRRRRRYWRACPRNVSPRTLGLPRVVSRHAAKRGFGEDLKGVFWGVVLVGRGPGGRGLSWGARTDRAVDAEGLRYGGPTRRHQAGPRRVWGFIRRRNRFCDLAHRNPAMEIPMLSPWPFCMSSGGVEGRDPYIP